MSQLFEECRAGQRFIEGQGRVTATRSCGESDQKVGKIRASRSAESDQLDRAVVVLEPKHRQLGQHAKSFQELCSREAVGRLEDPDQLEQDRLGQEKGLSLPLGTLEHGPSPLRLVGIVVDEQSYDDIGIERLQEVFLASARLTSRFISSIDFALLALLAKAPKTSATLREIG